MPVLVANEIGAIFFALFLLLSSSFICGKICEIINAPKVVGEIVGGMLIGASCVGHFYPEFFNNVFNSFAAEGKVLNIFYQLGLVLLMFMSGFNTTFSITRKNAKNYILLFLGATIIPMMLGILFVPMFQGNFTGTANNEWAFAIVFVISVAITSINNTQLSYAKAYHDYTNELWHWWASGRNATHYEAAQEIKINALVNHLCSRTPVYAGNTNRVITDMDLINSDAVKQANGTYDVTLTVKLNATVSNQDNVVISVKNASGELSSINAVAGQDTYSMSFNTADISSMTVSANGTQNLGTDAYLYIPLGGKEVSQVLVGMSSGETVIKTEMTVHGAE